ncbi:MAG: sel1 repeat family protein [gamma proteobacterium symbiont of Bathyaustriella thionipta]|nr:sel1 repeat family protein [gamma proteobacterium symbiont of Bathyaustriella thionipta]
MAPDKIPVRPDLFCFFLLLVLLLLGSGLVVAATSADFQRLQRMAKDGNPLACYELAGSYELGLDTAANPAEALRWYRKAAELGNARAQHQIGNAYYFGRLGLKKDYIKAHAWIEKSAQQNYSPALSLLSGMYAVGQGVKQDRKKAEQLKALAKKYSGQLAEKDMAQLRRDIAKVKSAETPPATDIPRQAVAEASSPQTSSASVVTSRSRSAERAPAAKQKPAKKPVAQKKVPTVKKKKPDTQKLISQNRWTEKSKPAIFLPSMSTHCSTRGNKLTCLSDEQTGARDGMHFGYKVKSILSGFQPDGRFALVYKNRITWLPGSQTSNSAAQPASQETEEEFGEVTSVASHSIPTHLSHLKPGWQKEVHKLQCRIHDSKTIRCSQSGRRQKIFNIQ